MDGLNRVMLLGNLGADPDLRVTQAGQAVLSLRLATTESYLDKDKVRRERTEWHNVVIWAKRAEALAKILVKGSSILVEGSLRTSSYDDREGVKRYKTEVIAREVYLTGGRPGAAQSDGDHAPTPRDAAHRGAAPARSGGGYRPPAPAATAPAVDDYDGLGYVVGEDNPF